MNDLFERYIAVQLGRALAGSGIEVVAQGGLRYALGAWRGEQDCIGNSHSTRPDILIRRGDEVACVIDTKWKRFADGTAQSDVYQMIACARLYRCDRLVLLYPAIPSEVATDLHPRGLARGPERLDISSVALGKSGPDIQQALRRLVGGLLNWPAQSGAPVQHSSK